MGKHGVPYKQRFCKKCGERLDVRENNLPIYDCIKCGQPHYYWEPEKVMDLLKYPEVK